jgi:hypothetical protein
LENEDPETRRKLLDWGEKFTASFGLTIKTTRQFLLNKSCELSDLAHWIKTRS